MATTPHNHTSVMPAAAGIQNVGEPNTGFRLTLR